MTCGGIGALRGCVNALAITAAAVAAAALLANALGRRAPAQAPAFGGGGRPALAACHDAPPTAACEVVWRAARAAFLARP